MVTIIKGFVPLHVVQDDKMGIIVAQGSRLVPVALWLLDQARSDMPIKAVQITKVCGLWKCIVVLELKKG